jgi:signal transduction histidine kinase
LVLTGGIAWKVVSLRRRNALLVQFSRHLDTAREEERKMAARDIHDEIGQHLMVLNLHAYWLSSHPEAGEQERQSRVKDIQTGILEAMASVKAVASRLRPTAIDALEFSEALRWYVGSFSRLSGIRTSLDLDSSTRVTGDLATALFRIAQELLSNVQRHSNASQVELSFRVDGDRLVLMVKDDGKGIADTDVSAPDSFGIIGMRERCRAFGGTLEICGQPGKGTVAQIRLPRSKNDGEDKRHA